MKKFRRYNVFISSTFRDMDFERDILKFKVIPRINTELKNYNVELTAIDLRVGINTEKLSEEKAAQKVLDVCAQSIDNSRPFFIGLIGSRYGWIPSDEDWNKFISRLPQEYQFSMQDTCGKSVTEIEIMYGALNQKSLDNSNVLFFMRNFDSYEDIPSEFLDKYVDKDPEKLDKLVALKQRIYDTINTKGGDDDYVIPYSLKWNRESNDFNDDNSEFEELAYKLIMHHVVAEIEDNDYEYNWQIEKDVAISALEAKLPGICTDLPFFEKRLENTLFVGDVGSGRSTLLAYQYKLYSEQTNDICLFASLNKSIKMLFPRYLLTMWCLELASILGEEPCDAYSFVVDEEVGIQTICDDFYWLVDKANDKGRRVTVFIDDVDAFFRINPHGAFLPWLDYRVNVIATTSLDLYKETILYHNNFEVVTIDTLSKSNLKKLISSLENKYYFELPEKVKKKLVKDDHLPVFISTWFRMCSLLNSVDFDEIRSKISFQSALEKYLLSFLDDIIYSCDNNEELMANSFLTVICKMYGYDVDWYQNLLGYLSSSPFGFTLDDLRQLAGDNWDDVEWQHISYFLSDFLEEEFFEKRIIAKSSYFGLDENTPYNDIVSYYETYPPKDDSNFDNFGYAMLNAETPLVKYNSKIFPLSFSLVYALINNDWFEDGKIDDLCEVLSDNEISELIAQLYNILAYYDKNNVLPVEVDKAFDNWEGLFSFSKKERNKFISNLDTIDNQFSYKIKFTNALNKIYEHRPELKNNKNGSEISNNEYLSELYKIREKNPIAELLSLQDILCDINNFLKYEERINKEFQLEYILFVLLHVCGAATNIIKTQSIDGENVKVISGIIDSAEYGFIACYYRLRYAYPFNSALNKIAMMMELSAERIAERESCIYPHSNNIKDCLSEIINLIGKL